MKRIKRFYDTVSIAPVAEGRFGLLLNGKRVRTPLGEQLVFPNEGTAVAVATEWQLQKDFIVPNTMPMSTILMTYIDIDSKAVREDKLAQIGRFLQTDTLRFPDLNKESELWKLQAERWSPIIAYMNSRGASLTRSTTGFGLPAEANAEVQVVKETILTSYDMMKLTMLETAAKYLKSGSIGIGLIEGAVTPTQAFEAAYVEELSQRTNWGLVEGDHDVNDAETLLWLNGISILAKLD
jgi:chaperone required for assembly of F1-ATPase